LGGINKTSGYKLPGKSNKLTPPRTGPFKVVRVISPLAYELEFPDTSQVHPVVSIAHLLPARVQDDPFNRQTVPPGPVTFSDEEADNPGDVYEVETVLDARKSRGKHQYLIRWKGWGPQFDQWVKEEDVRAPKLVDAFWESLRHDTRLQKRNTKKKPRHEDTQTSQDGR
jgi:hypothetical protein